MRAAAAAKRGQDRRITKLQTSRLTRGTEPLLKPWSVRRRGEVPLRRPLSHMIDTDFRLLVSAETPRESALRAAEAIPAGGVFYYALGGGMGHLMRAHAIGRAFTRLD